MSTSLSFSNVQELYVRQRRELAELFGFETRNKYAITTHTGQDVLFAAEQRSGLLGALAMYFLGHWRSFAIVFFDTNRQEVFRAHHPFRLFFQRLDVSHQGRTVGAIQQRWAFLSKRFDVLDASGRVLFEMRSGMFTPWTFPFFRGDTRLAVIEKKWAGLVTEMFTDKETFRVAFLESQLNSDQRMLVLAAAVFVDLQYFERKAQ